MPKSLFPTGESIGLFRDEAHMDQAYANFEAMPDAQLINGIWNMQRLCKSSSTGQLHNAIVALGFMVCVAFERFAPEALEAALEMEGEPDDA